MIIQKTIEEKLSTELSPILLQVVNESYKHNVAEGSESHFQVTLVSERFEALGLVKRHQLVYAVLETELAGAVHALALHTLTPSEWEARSEELPGTPDCKGGSKS